MAVCQTILVLGGGVYPDGTLTNLSRQRLDAAVELYRSGEAPTITVLGGLVSTYLPTALEFGVSGAEKRAAYLARDGIPPGVINRILGGKDTIGEAIAARAGLPSFGIRSLILVTSTEHMARASWLFSTILGPDYRIIEHPVSSEGLLIAAEEAEYFAVTRSYFDGQPGCLEDTSGWHDKHAPLYAAFKAIHDLYHPPGKESEAYCAVTAPPLPTP